MLIYAKQIEYWNYNNKSHIKYRKQQIKIIAMTLK